ncbi:hypothetical protein ACIGH6_14250 [Brachybacterium paraconglomeratum]|uniref:hypothetical protein n=1 Tax=Brachybacterium paraconglomeratum TaxID=173362 RepID=UPI0037CB8D27
MEMPTDLVTVEDVKERFYRALTPDEERITRAWIEDAWDDLLDRPGLALAARLEAGEVGLLARVGRTIRAAVLRRLQNPQGRRQFSYTVDDATVSETLASETLAGAWFTDEELDRLAPPGAASDAFTIRTDAHLPDPPAHSGVFPWISL